MTIRMDVRDDLDRSIHMLRRSRNEQQLSFQDVAGCGMTFNVVDVETANNDRSTICQIGIVHVVDGRVADKWGTLVDPEDDFGHWNVKIHGITPEQVQGAPALPEIREELRQRLRGQVLVSHTAFDRSAFKTAMDKYNLEQLQVYWLDSAKIARRAWPDKFSRAGYGLKNVANFIGYEFKHHDAVEDAAAAAEITLAACRERDVNVEYWLHEFRIRSANKKIVTPVSTNANPEGDLHGEVLVFTGRLQMTRKSAVDCASFMGCEVAKYITGKTTILVVGVQNLASIASPSGKSRKHLRAENLISKGQEIRIISETDFISLLAKHKLPVPLQTSSAEKNRQNKQI